MVFQLKAYESTQGLQREGDSRTSKLVNLITHQERMIGTLDPIKEVQYRSMQSKEIRTSSMIRAIANKMDVDGFIQDKNDQLIEEDLKGLDVENHRRLYLPSIV